ncbi:basic salivary proline-rich protein 3-like [Bombina bombina]|uniref:basic salivary proline-rich protein 3-like n=1 Tax=Bombina bombina TaxID=8345 RepID=UPI00235A69A5|nr:basic salivary proline-rich protein 3-like [Bombina bombina]
MKYIILVALVMQVWAHPPGKNDNRAPKKEPPRGVKPPEAANHVHPSIPPSGSGFHSHLPLNVTGIPQHHNSSHPPHLINSTDRPFHKGLPKKPEGGHHRPIRALGVAGKPKPNPPKVGTPPPHQPEGKPHPAGIGPNATVKPFSERPDKLNNKTGEKPRPKRDVHQKDSSEFDPTGQPHSAEDSNESRPPKPSLPPPGTKGAKSLGKGPKDNHGPPQGKRPH